MSIERQDADHYTTEMLPALLFEGQKVDGVVMKIRGRTPIQDDDVHVSVDDRVLLITEARCVEVRHYADENGKLIREQVLKPMRATRGKWDPNDPTDDGIIRPDDKP